MKVSRLLNFRPVVGKVLLGLVLSALIGSVSAIPAQSEDRNRDGRHDNGRYEKRGQGYDRGGYYNKNGQRYYRKPVYRERVYVAPPPVIYAPPEPPGISFFFPPIIFRP
jgi:hypothetical protein